ncbi:DUF2345 domain-containing protein, partial [Burkholderia ubonensis]|uniref:DUF2345 domain-containing protein n=1 Tax=Burkholderia ubonensis TaxID=101571 RepID=UPI00210DEAD6
KLGIKIVAAKGPVEVQAQDGPMSLIANKDVTVASVNDVVYVRAETELTLGSGGAFIQLKDGNITLGGPLDLLLKVNTIQKKGAAQMHLGVPAFTTRMVPFTIACDAWRGTTGFAESISTAPIPNASDWNKLGNPAVASAEAPALVASSVAPSKESQPNPPQQGAATSVNSPDGPNADHDSAHEPKKPLSDDVSVPIRMEKPGYCDWQRPSFSVERTDKTETGSYYGFDWYKHPYPTPDVSGARPLSGNQFDTAFELSYDDRSKTLYATVRVKIVPVDLFQCDPSGTPLRAPDGKPQSIPYETSQYWRVVANGVDRPMNGCVLKYRAGTEPSFDIETRKRQVEAVLNDHRSKLILNGCSKDAACGCRVSVVFKVEFLLSINNAPVGDGKKIHKTVNLFPRAQRADAGSWGEVNMYQERQPDQSVVWKDMQYVTNVIAHECGHLFNFPDEYWQMGGWVHNQYIKDQQLDFAMGEVNKQKETWQIYSEGNVMGGGCNKPAPTGDNVRPSAAARPYYLEYVRRHFCALSGEKPQYLNNDKSKPIWRRWRIGYEF